MIKSYEFFINTETKYIDFINKIMEAYEGIGIIRTLDAKNGKIKIITLEHFREETVKIIDNLRKNGVVLEIEREGIWEGVL